MLRRLNLKFALAVPAALLLLAAGPTPANAALMTSVTSTVTPGAGGLTSFSYVLTNSATSTVGVEEFDVSVSPDATLSAITNPTGFLALYTQGDSFIQFLSTDPSTDIAPGASGVFSFLSDTGPAVGAFQTQGLDATTTALTQSGTMLTPTAVPEPSTLVLGAAGVLALLGRPTYRRLTGPKSR